MKKTIGEWLFLSNAISNLLEYDLPGTLALRAAISQDAIGQRLQSFDKQKQKLYALHGKDGDKPGSLFIPQENLNSFRAAIEPLIAMVVEVQVEKIPRDEITTAGKVKGTLIRSLQPLIGD